MRPLRLFLFCIVYLLCISSLAVAATITVNTTADELNSSGNCSLREAIRSANLDVAVDACTAGNGADEIILPAGTYTLTIAATSNEDAALNGDLDLTGTLTVTGAGADTTIIEACAIVPPATSCTGLDRVFDIRPGANVTITGVTIRHGTVVGIAGGGIFVDGGGGAGGATLTLTDSVVSDNVAGDAGGLRQGGAMATLTRTTVARNRTTSGAGGGGAGILNFTGTLILLDSAVIDNQAAGGSGSFGGGVYNLATAVITDSTISGNTTAVHGGGIYNSSGLMTVTGSTISHNTAALGGGIRNFAPLTLTNSTVSGNAASTGGGIANSSNTLNLVNATVTDNSVVNQGGGLFVEAGTVNLKNTILAANVDTNAVVLGNSPDCSGAVTSQGYNLVGTVGTFGVNPACTGVTDGVNGDQVGTDASPIDPQLTPLADHGGPTLTHGLLIGSPAIDTGNPDPPGSGGDACEATDQRGESRTVAGGGDGDCDIGAFEGVVFLPLDHFLCYKGKVTTGFQSQVVTLKDQFDDPAGPPQNVTVKKPASLCNPADKNGEGINEPDIHLMGYKIKQEALHEPVTGIIVKNQFHPDGLSVDTIKPDRLLVPTAKDLTDPVPAPDPDSHGVDHYKCYKVKVTPGTPKLPKGIQALVKDQFNDPAKLFDIKKPRRLCNPVDKEGEGIKNPDQHLMCYKVKAAPGQPKHVPVKGIFVNNQFGPEQLDTIKEEELCVPSEKIIE